MTLGERNRAPTWHPREWNLGVGAGESVRQVDARELGAQEAKGGGDSGQQMATRGPEVLHRSHGREREGERKGDGGFDGVLLVVSWACYLV